MSHTNSTTNYNLPQFVGSDKPTWLTDVNGAMSAIDAQMKLNADSATTAGTDATTANTSIGTLANLTTTAKTNVVSAINEVDGDVSTVAGVASNASTTANNAKTTADGLVAYLSLTQFNDLTWTVTSGSISNASSVLGVKSAANADGTLGKIYGDYRFTCTNASGCTITSSDTGLRPTEAITINGVAFRQNAGTGSNGQLSPQSITINTNGTVSLSLSSAWYNVPVSISFMACVIFATNFGDISE